MISRRFNRVLRLPAAKNGNPSMTEKGEALPYDKGDKQSIYHYALDLRAPPFVRNPTLSKLRTSGETKARSATPSSTTTFPSTTTAILRPTSRKPVSNSKPLH